MAKAARKAKDQDDGGVEAGPAKAKAMKASVTAKNGGATKSSSATKAKAVKAMKAMNAMKVAARKPSKPQALKQELVLLAKEVAAVARRSYKPQIVRERPNCAGLVLGQAPPGPRSSLPKGWQPLAGPAEQRLAKLAGLAAPSEFWADFDRANLLSWYPGLKARAAKHEVAQGYKLHQSDGDVFPMDEARRAAAALDLTPYAYVILLGNNVARAFGVKAALLEAEVRGDTKVLAFPHPSGVSHFWNDPANVARAAKVIKRAVRAVRKRRALAEVAEGDGDEAA